MNGFINQIINLYVKHSCEAFCLDISLAKSKQHNSERSRLNKDTMDSLEKHFYDMAPKGKYAKECNTLPLQTIQTSYPL